MTVRIALDAMGGDHAPQAVVEGAVCAAGRNPSAHFLLVGIQEVIERELSRLRADRRQFTVHTASQVVEMDEKPSVALRNKKDSSMRVGANLVHQGDADAFVSSGNTGALMAISRFVLKTLPGIDRPAIASWLPSITGQTMMLDAGANVDCSVEHLLQFALMGYIYASVVLGVDRPRIGLLNIGSEEMKGNEVVRQTGEKLRELFLSYVGNVEGRDIFSGKVDVVVCDGFVGNVSLKTAEGVAQMLSHFLQEAFRQSLLARVGYVLAYRAFRYFRSRVDHRKYNGALLLGLNGLVIKSHGSADAYAYAQAVQLAVNLAGSRMNERIRNEAANLLAVVKPVVAPSS
ncbi:MAG: phosphate acyltransferase PlsX [Magnetococcales bacterium]|nr:phosphate acyltransferase PlsX [Magnetococcales bacterium]